MRASSPRESALRPTPSTEPVLFLRTRAPVGDAPFDAFARWPSARCCRWESLHHETTDLWHPLSPAGTLDRHHPPRACRVCRFHEHPRLTPPISRPTTHPTNACAPARSSDPVAFRRRFRRRPTRPEPLLRHPSEGMTQPRLGMPSTVSTNRELAPVVRNAAYSELNRTTLRTPFRLGFCRGPRQAVIHGGFRLVPGLTLTALRRCALLARDACDRLLPSTASISSTRVSFVLRRPRGSRLRTFSASVCATCPGGVASRRTSDRAPSGFTPPWWLRCIDALAFVLARASRRILPWRSSSIESVSCLSRPLWCTGLRIPSQWPTHLPGAKTAPQRSPWRLHHCTIRHDFHRKVHFFDWHLATPAAHTVELGSAGMRACSTLVVLPPPGLALRPFTETMPCCFVQSRLFRLGPRSRPRIGLMRTLL